MESKAEDFVLIKQAISVERFESHRKGDLEPESLVFARHQWNAQIGEQFYGPLQILEVVLRNSFNRAIAAKCGDSDWLTKVPPWLQPNGREDVVKAHEFLLARRRPITQARVVQEMSFGFWTSLLNSRYETLFHGVGAQVFAGMPRPLRTRANASGRFENIRALRNRIFHFRRIWNRPDLGRDYEEILEAIEWINPDARRLLLPTTARTHFREVFALRP